MDTADTAEARAEVPEAETEDYESRPGIRTKKQAVDSLKDEFHRGLKLGEELLFVDECDVHLQPLLGSNWHPKGEQNQVEDARQNRKTYCFGAIDFARALVTCRMAERKRSGEFVEFLSALRRQYVCRIHIVLDNCSAHSSREVKKFLEKHPGGFEFHFLPTYSPWLNPMETVWREMKSAVCRNHFHGTLENLKLAVSHYFITHAIHEGALHAAA